MGVARKVGLGIAGALEGGMQGYAWAEDLKRKKEQLQLQQDQLAQSRKAMEFEQDQAGLKGLMSMGQDIAAVAVDNPEAVPSVIASRMEMWGKIYPRLAKNEAGWIHAAFTNGTPEEKAAGAKVLSDFHTKVTMFAEGQWAKGETFELNPEQQNEVRKFERAMGPAVSGLLAAQFQKRNEEVLKLSQSRATVRGAGLENEAQSLANAGTREARDATKAKFGVGPEAVKVQAQAGLEPVAGKPGEAPIQMAPPVPTGNETTTRKAMGKKQGEQLADELNALPELEGNVAGLDRALSLVDKVITGPLAGKDGPFFAQKLTNEDAQAINQALAEQSVKKMMEFAQKAGVRSIDTPQEQQRLFDSIANKTLSAKTLRATLQRMRAQVVQAMEITNRKQAHVLEFGNLEGFKPLGDKPTEKVTAKDIDKMSKEELKKFLGEE